MNKYWLTVEGIGDVVLRRDYDNLHWLLREARSCVTSSDIGRRIDAALAGTGQPTVLVPDSPPPCPKCGTPYFSHPRLGFTHTCTADQQGVTL